jgi:hypothetical protein
MRPFWPGTCPSARVFQLHGFDAFMLLEEVRSLFGDGRGLVDDVRHSLAD